ncbi:MAG: 3-oxoacyl-ACP reductase family protein [Desulfobacteraceae bacterium]|jgi:NAD(P)-dependent dehydrogenase (short-subunit alcohol dehydrogenase family)
MNTSDIFRLDGKIALVTGSARGLGKEIALGLSQYGASLVLVDIAYPEKTAEQVAATGARCIALKTDISNEAEVKNLGKEATSKFGKLDILINNAGVTQLTYTPTEELPVEEWDQVMGINLRGTFLCCKYLGGSMIRTGGGNIVNIASTAGFVGVQRAPAYCASKAGVILLTKSLALEWAQHNIRVNAIAPHYLETELTKGLRDSHKVHEALLRQIPLKRFGKTRELIGAVLFLSSDTSSYVTGAVIPVDGGYLAQ